MKPDDVKTVGVLGCGIMGSGIVEVLAKAGTDVIYLERDDARVERGRTAIEASLQKAVSKGKLEEPARDEILGRVRGTTNLDDLAGVDLVIEAVTEDLATKVDLFERLDGLTNPEVVLASNTSSLPLVQMATATKRPDKVIGMHFFNPPPVMKLLELVKALTTSDETVEFAKGFGEKLGKTTSWPRTAPGSS